MIETKKIKYLFLVIAAILFVGLHSCGSDDKTSDDIGKYVGDVSDKKGGTVSVYIDLKNMQIEGQIREFWIRYYGKKSIGKSKESYMRQIGFWEVDCQDRTLHVLSEEYYGVDGQVLGRTEERFKEDYKEGSLGDKLASAACRYAGRN
jgi:Surface-adhesin protein E